MSRNKSRTPYQRLCSAPFLDQAWKKIYNNSLKSDSARTREEARLFNEDSRRNIDRIHRAIRAKKFVFENVYGVSVGKKKRPIVLAPVSGRVVQRAILDVLQDLSPIFKYLNAPGSYGALKSEDDNKKGVRAAIEAAVKAIQNGADHFYQSDIKSFFTQIPRGSVISTIASHIEDDDFISILNDATNLEVNNISRIPMRQRRFFDYNTIGTPQGCCLSPLLGNILLYEFDIAMNRNGVACLRYLDDFIVLGKGWKSVHDAFERGAAILAGLGLEVYKIDEKGTKAISGQVSSGIDFLGVEIKGMNIRPNRDSRQRLLESILSMTQETFKQEFSEPQNKELREHSLVATLRAIDNKAKGWGNQYSFCNEEAIWGAIDGEINEILRSYLGRYSEIRKKLDKKSKRRLLGIHLISESKKDQIYWSD